MLVARGQMLAFNGHQMLFITRHFLDSTNIQSKIHPHFSFNSNKISPFYSVRHSALLLWLSPVLETTYQTVTEAYKATWLRSESAGERAVIWPEAHSAHPPVLCPRRLFWIICSESGTGLGPKDIYRSTGHGFWLHVPFY